MVESVNSISAGSFVSRQNDVAINLMWAEAKDRQGRNGVIGYRGTMPWHITEDLQRFRKLTQYHPVIMGRKTWDSLGDKYRPLPKRHNIVVTANQQYVALGATVVHSLVSAFASAFAYTNKIEQIQQDNLSSAIKKMMENMRNQGVNGVTACDEIPTRCTSAQSHRQIVDENNIDESNIDRSEIWVIGGGQIFEETLPIATRVYVTQIDEQFSADTYAPNIYALIERGVLQEIPSLTSQWNISTSKGALPYRFITYRNTSQFQLKR